MRSTFVSENVLQYVSRASFGNLHFISFGTGKFQSLHISSWAPGEFVFINGFVKSPRRCPRCLDWGAYKACGMVAEDHWKLQDLQLIKTHPFAYRILVFRHFPIFRPVILWACNVVARPFFGPAWEIFEALLVRTATSVPLNDSSCMLLSIRRNKN
jgi:hypothetical protein